MPSFSFLKSSRGDGNHDQHGPVAAESEQETPEKAQRRQSRRDFFRALIKKPIVITDANPSRWRGSQSMKKPAPLQLQSPRSPDSPSTPMSDTNKPLPPPPPPGTTNDEPIRICTSTPKPATKLARIIAPIAPDELHKLFSGAPQFFARSEGHHTGAPHPSVAFPWNTEVEIRDLCDHVQIHDEAWGSVTAWPHITVQVSKDADAAKEHHRKQRAHFMPRCRERPNMLSMQGLERGTVGYGAALELGVADALRSIDDIRETSPEAVMEHRKKFLNNKEGLRPLTDSVLIESLLSVSETYHEDPMKHRRPTLELYTQLFTKILYPPSRVTDSQDPYSLQVQIEALIGVLAAPFVWVDFGLVEWRIRLGQILWGASSDVTADEEIAINNEVMHEPGTQKYWLLLQILLSCELLLRLDAVSMNIDHGLEAAKPSELRRFDKSATSSVRWSIILARQWMENIQIEKVDPTEEKKAAPGWLATLTGTAADTPKITESIDHLKFRGRNQTTQISGLVHFARKLGWPDIDNLTAKIAANGITMSETIQGISAAGTPLSTVSAGSNSYFAKPRPGMRKGLLPQRGIAALTNPSGWLSNSYLSGLILPGESLAHFLMSTLLENDELAVAKLGDETNLYGGFVYSKQSYWSTACVIGRVLAAKKGGHECIGWISTPVVPRGVKEGWVDIDVEPAVQNDTDKQGGKPRIWHKTQIESDGNVIGGADASSVLPGDFVIPSDESYQKPFTVTLESLDLFSAVDEDSNSIQETPTPNTEGTNVSRIQTYSAMMRFMIDSDKDSKREVNLALSHDVQFVTAHPCVPSPYTDILRTPTSPTFQIPEQSSIRSVKASGNHPLHKAFTYVRIPILDLLFTSSTTPFSAILSPPASPITLDPTQSSTHTTNSKIPKVLVIDCTDSSTSTTKLNPPTSPTFPSRPGTPVHVGILVGGHKHGVFGSDLEMLARALCAERGWNALVSRKGRGCVSCAVREAGALGWRVVVRLA